MNEIAARTAVPGADSLATASSAARMLRVCFVSADYPTVSHGGIGGIGAHSYALAHALAALGHDISVIAEAAGPPGRMSDGPIQVHAVSRGSRRQWKLGRFVPIPWIRWSFAVDRALRHLHAQTPLDVVVFPDAYGEGFRFALSPFVPFVVRFGGPASVVQRWDGRLLNPIRARIETWLERTPSSRAPILMCASRAFADQMAGDWSLDASRFRIVRNPLNLERFRPAAPDFRRTGRRVLFVGHLQPLKGLHELVAAVPTVARRHPDVEFQLVGNDTRTGPDRTSLKLALTQTLRDQGTLERVHFLDPLPQPDLVPLYRSCTVFVLPSHHDVYPNAVLEAMGCGRPCVVTSTAGVAELVSRSNCGIVVPPGNADALAAAISELLAMPEATREEMGARGRRIVEQVCAMPVIAAQAVDVYREAIEQYRSRGRSRVGANT